MELVHADEARAAAARLGDVVDLTPLTTSRALSDAAGHPVLLKCENLQRTGSFKLRGAFNRIARLSDAERARGVVCASAGNHAQGVALAARLQGVRATVFMPRQAPLPKVEATRAEGADIRLTDGTFDDALAAAETFARAEGAMFVHPFDHPDVIAGQATVGLELLRQVHQFAERDAVGTVVVPVGGGGLCAGVALAVKEARPRLRVVGVEASGAASVAASLAAGAPRPAERLETIADGIAVKTPGRLTLAHLAAYVDEVVAVDDDAIARAVVFILEHAKLLVEPAGSVGVAALLSGAFTAVPPVVVVLSGGNIDPLVLQHVITDGLTAAGRYVTIRTQVSDRPGQLHLLLGLLADRGANVVAVEHHRYQRRLKLEEVEVVIELEARGHRHVDEIRAALDNAGYPAEVI